MLASVYTDDEERGHAIGIALGGLALGVLGRTGRSPPTVTGDEGRLFASLCVTPLRLHSRTSLRQRDV